MSPPSGITVVKSCPQEELFFAARVCREQLIGDKKWSCVLVESFIVWENNIYAIRRSPSYRPFRIFSNVNYPWRSAHELNIDGRSLSCIFDTEAATKFFSLFGFSCFPCRCALCSGLDSGALISQPSPLIQTQRFSRLVDLLPVDPHLLTSNSNLSFSRVGSFSRSSRRFFGGGSSSLSGNSLLLHFLQGVGELLSVLSERVSGDLVGLKNKIGLNPSENDHDYSTQKTDRSFPSVPSYLKPKTLRNFGFTIIVFGVVTAFISALLFGAGKAHYIIGSALGALMILFGIHFVNSMAKK